MPAVQTAYNINHVAAYPGLIASLYGTIIETRLAAAQVNFGTVVVQRAAPADGADQCANPAATADVTARMRGIAIHDETQRGSISGAGGFGYELNRPVKYLRRGLIWMVAEAAIAQDTSGFVRFAAGTFSTLGALRADADTATAVQYAAYPNGIVVRSATQQSYLANGVTQLVCLVEVNLP